MPEKIHRQDSHLLYQFDKRYSWLGCIIGVDEAGRGPIAGPVVAAAVILPYDKPIPGIMDSKKIPPDTRINLFDQVNSTAIEVSTGICSHKEIDRINIYQASRMAMEKAVSKIKTKFDAVITDYMRLSGLNSLVIPIVKGDQKSACIAAASIIAKVTRDRIMEEYHEIYPQYGFDKHKGYPTPQHKKAVLEHGILPIHRKTFNPIKTILNSNC